MDNNVINIAYCFNDNYAEHSCVSMISVLEHTKSNIHFHIIESSVSDNMKNLIELSLSNYSNTEITYYKYNSDDIVLPVHAYITVETYYKLFLADILGDKVEKLIYLDSDIIVLNDIKELFDIDMNNYAIAMHPLSRKPDSFHILKARDLIYFNSGVLLINCARFRQLKIKSNIVRLSRQLYSDYEKDVKNTKRPNAWNSEESILNYLVNTAEQNICKSLDVKFNFPDAYHHERIDHNERPYPFENFRDAFRNPTIVHYLGYGKPWNTFKEMSNSIYWKKYYDYKQKTAFADSKDEIAIEEYLKYENEAFNSKFCFAQSEIEKHFFYKIFDKLIRSALPKIANRKIVILGYGRYLKALLLKLDEQGLIVTYVSDTKTKFQGYQEFEYRCVPPNFLRERYNEYFIIVNSFDRLEGLTYLNFLKDFGYSEDDVLCTYSFFLGGPDPLRIFSDLEQTLEKGNIVIYGAGFVSMVLVQYIAKIGKLDSIKCIVVSNGITQKPFDILGIPVVNFGEMSCYATAPDIIIATLPKLHSEIYDYLISTIDGKLNPANKIIAPRYNSINALDVELYLNIRKQYSFTRLI